MKNNNDKNLVVNTKARFEYQIIEEFQAGIQLLGWETKACRLGKIDISNCWIQDLKGELYLRAMVIEGSAALQAGVNREMSKPGRFTTDKVSTYREKKLLLNRSEIDKITGHASKDGFTIIPLNIHLSNNRVKCQLALVKGKRDYDKRVALKERDTTREIQRVMKSASYGRD